VADPSLSSRSWVLQWTAVPERGQLPLQKLLEKPSGRKGLLRADTDARRRCTALSKLEIPCFEAESSRRRSRRARTRTRARGLWPEPEQNQKRTALMVSSW
jgi:hypothetical protein